MLIISLKFLIAPVFGDQAVFVILVLHKLSVFSLVKPDDKFRKIVLKFMRKGRKKAEMFSSVKVALVSDKNNIVYHEK